MTAAAFDPPVAEQIQPELERARDIAESRVDSFGDVAEKEYARGVRNALMWVMGETELAPMDPDEDDMPDYEELGL